MFERFTMAARDVVVRAQSETRSLGHARVGSEHLLLSLSAADTATARLLRDLGATPDRIRSAVATLIGGAAIEEGQPDPAALRTIGIDLDAVRRSVEDAFGPGALAHARFGRTGGNHRVPGHVPFTAEAKTVLERSLREALALKHRYIGTEHIALGLTFDQRNAAARVLATIGLTAADVRQRVLDALTRPANSA